MENNNSNNSIIKKHNFSVKSLIISLVIVVVLILIDQLTKMAITNNMKIGESISVIDGFFYITSHRNTGGAWGIGSGDNLWFFIIITIVALVAYVFFYKFVNFKNMLVYSIGLSLIVAGTLGNFIDRLFKGGKVVDFLDFIIFGYDFPIFNIADMCLVVGVILICIDILFGKTGKLWSN